LGINPNVTVARGLVPRRINPTATVLNLFEGGNRASPIPSEFLYLNTEAAPPFCYLSWEAKQTRRLTKEIIFLN